MCIHWVLAELRHNKIRQSPPEIAIGLQLQRKRGLLNYTIYVSFDRANSNFISFRDHGFLFNFNVSLKLRKRLHETRFVWKWYEIGTDKPCVHTGPEGSSTLAFCQKKFRGGAKDNRQLFLLLFLLFF